MGLLDGVMPPAPRPEDTAPPGQMPSGGAPSGPPALAALSQALKPPPAPTHGQTVAALRHFGAIGNVLNGLLSDPAVGKSDLKSKIIDGVTGLVAQRMVAPADAVKQLGDVPDNPFKQRQWLQQHAQAIQQAEMAVLAHHGNAYRGVPEKMIDKTAKASSHMDDMKALQGHYR